MMDEQEEQKKKPQSVSAWLSELRASNAVVRPLHQTSTQKPREECSFVGAAPVVITLAGDAERSLVPNAMRSVGRNLPADLYEAVLPAAADTPDPDPELRF